MNNFRVFLQRFLRGGRVSLQDKINFARHLSIIIRAGLPLLEGLRIIKKQTANKTLLVVLERLVADVSGGQFLASSLERFPELFDQFFVNVVRVGEASGTLADNLLYLAEELKKARSLKNKIKSAMIYPLVIMAATIVLISFLVFFAFPKLLPLFAGLNVPLPLPTRILIATASLFLNNWLWVVVAILAAALVFRALLLIRPTRFLLDQLLFRMPIFSGLVVDINMANLARVLGVLLKGGIKIVEAVAITSHTLDNLVYEKELLRASEEVRRGEPLARYLAQQKRYFPPLLSGLIEIGENTGNLEENLGYLADYYREESELRIHNLTTLIEPALLLVMGLLVGFVAISVITPIYSVTQGRL